MIHLYAIVEGLERLPEVRGIGGAPVERASVAGLDAVVSFHDGSTEPVEDAVLAHAQVVERVLEASTSTLPVRFMRGFADMDALESALASKGEELRESLPRVRGCVEVGVRVLAPAARAGVEPARGGADYMRARLGELASARGLADDLHHALAEAARESERTDVGTGRFLLSGVYLVPSRDVPAFMARVRGLQDAHRDLGVVCTGPWPPYSFASLAAETDGDS